MTVVGDALLDRDVAGEAHRLAPDAPVPVVDETAARDRPGGAALAAVLAARHGAEVTLVTALGADEAGRRIAGLLEAAGVELIDLRLAGRTPEKVRVLAGDRPVVRVDRGGPGGEPGPLSPAAREAIADADAVLVSDYGRGLAERDDVRAALAGARVVWDPHPRGPEPVRHAVLATPNAAEAAGFAGGTGDAADHATILARRWDAEAVCVTRGAGGALLSTGDGPPLAVPAPAAKGDPCGAGDCFAATAAVAIAAGEPPAEAVEAAVAAASAFVAAGGAGSVRLGAPAAPDPAVRRDALSVAAAVRARGGTVVATGGCFDLLHAGHVDTLTAARAQGDCLIVLLNSDASVARLKGPGRPLVGEHDRAAVLSALGCVDAVMVFDDDEPSAALGRLRPDVWVKGGDYAVEDLPESEVLAGWGARIVLVPFKPGRSTTRLIEEAAARGR